MSKPPGVPGTDGPLSQRKRAILPFRVGLMRVGVVRVGFANVDVDATASRYGRNWREDPEPGSYGGVYAGTKVVS